MELNRNFSESFAEQKGERRWDRRQEDGIRCLQTDFGGNGRNKNRKPHVCDIIFFSKVSCEREKHEKFSNRHLYCILFLTSVHGEVRAASLSECSMQ